MNKQSDFFRLLILFLHTMIKIDLNKKLWQWFTLVFLSLIWGTSFILIKRGLETYNEFQIAGLRMFSAFIAILPFIKPAFRKIQKKHIPYLLFIAIIGNGVTAFLFAISQKHINSSVAGMLNAITPITTFLIGVLFYKTKRPLYKIKGLAIGLTGTVLLLTASNSTAVNNSFLYMGLLILASGFYSVNVNMVKFNLKELNGFTISVLTFSIIGPIGGIVYFSSDLTVLANQNDFYINTFYIILLGLLSSVLATVIFNILIQYSSTIFASTVTYLIPIVAVSWGVLDGEKVSIYQILSIFIIIAGIYLVNKD